MNNAMRIVTDKTCEFAQFGPCAGVVEKRVPEIQEPYVITLCELHWVEFRERDFIPLGLGFEVRP